MKQGDQMRGFQRFATSPPDFRALFESTPGFYLVISPDLTIVAASDAYLRLTQTERQRIVGRKIPSVFPDSRDNPGSTGLRNMVASLQRVLTNGVPDVMSVQRFDTPRPESQGGTLQERFWSLVNSPVLNSDGKVCWIIQCIEDVTESMRVKEAGRQRAEETRQVQEANHELTRLYERALELDRVKTSFLANVGHEFRTALPLILWPVESARIEGEGTLQGDALRAVHLKSLRLLKRVNELLAFAIVERDRIDLNVEPSDLSRITRELAEPLRPVVEKAGLELIIDCPPLPEDVYVDRSAWENIVLGLIRNALRHTFEGSIAVSIESRADEAAVLFRDTGIGISEDELPRLFERVDRLPGANSRNHDRNGVSLALVRELVEQQDGSIDVWSEEGRGTTFQVSFPLGRPAETLASMQATKPQEHILIVDEGAQTGSHLKSLLAPQFRVTLADNGGVALDSVRTDRPDLIVSKVMLPVIDGLTLVRHLREDPMTARIPIILVAACGEEDDALTGIEAGADDYLTTPFSDREFLARVRARLKLFQLQRVTAEAARELAESRAEHHQNLDVRSAEGGSSSTSTRHGCSPTPHIAGLIEILERDFDVSLDSRRKKYLSGIAAAAKEMDTLIDDLLNFARIRQVDSKKTSINLRGLVQSVIDKLHEPDNGPQTQWTLGNLPCVYGNAEMLRLVLLNLVSNALKFSSRRPVRRIEIAATEDRDGSVVFHVRDNGVGFDMKQADKLFGVFERLHSHGEFEGAGVGLAIVRRILQKHGGQTWATGAVGEGATFYCSLPSEGREGCV